MKSEKTGIFPGRTRLKVPRQRERKKTYGLKDFIYKNTDTETIFYCVNTRDSQYAGFCAVSAD